MLFLIADYVPNTLQTGNRVPRRSSGVESAMKTARSALQSSRHMHFSADDRSEQRALASLVLKWYPDTAIAQKTQPLTAGLWRDMEVYLLDLRLTPSAETRSRYLKFLGVWRTLGLMMTGMLRWADVQRIKVRNISFKESHYPTGPRKFAQIVFQDKGALGTTRSREVLYPKREDDLDMYGILEWTCGNYPPDASILPPDINQPAMDEFMRYMRSVDTKFQNITKHSSRHGGLMEFLRAGAPRELWIRQGGWHSAVYTEGHTTADEYIGTDTEAWLKILSLVGAP